MSLASSPLDHADAPLFADGLGERSVAADATTGELLQILRLRPALTAVPSFEFALRERTARLVNFRHAYYARVRRVDRVQANGSLAIVSDHVEGTRLSEILRVAQSRRLQLDINAALCLIRQLVPAVALMHENARDASHGLIAPERIVVTPHARLVIVEHVAGSAIEQLQFGRERLWQEFRIAMPSSAGMARFDHRADVNGIGVTALSLVLGRPLAADEFPHAIPSLLMQARERSPYGEERPLSNAFRNWLARMLQLDVRRAFASAPEALAGLEEMLAGDTTYVAAPVALETFLSQYTAVVHDPRAAGPLSVVSMPAAALAPVGVPALRAVEVPAPRAVDVPAPVPVAAPAAFAMPAVAWPTAAESPSSPQPLRDVELDPVRPFDAPTMPPTVDAASWVATFEAAPTASRSIQELPTLAELLAEREQKLTTDKAPAPAPAVSSLIESVKSPTAPEFAPAAEPIVETAAASSNFEDLDRVFGPIVIDAEETAGEESVPVVNDMPAPPRQSSRLRLVAVVVAVMAIIGGGAFAAKLYRGGSVNNAAGAELGMLIVQSSPAGVEVFVDGVSRGMTPARVSLPAGSHILELRGRGVPRVIPFQVPAGGQVSQYLEFADTPLTGLLVVHSQPAGANVTVDGVARGVAPLTLEGMSPGDHEVVLTSDTGTSKHTVKVLAGTTASLVAPVIPAAAEGPVSGWVSIKAPFTVEIREEGRLLGTTDSDRLMMAAGKHVLELVNQTLNYRESRVVQVAPGKVAAFSIDLPKGLVNLNASPWAEVWIDGKRVGDTPIGNLEVPIGSHEVVFRHPQFGEKRHAVSVTTAAPVRLSVSMK